MRRRSSSASVHIREPSSCEKTRAAGRPTSATRSSSRPSAAISLRWPPCAARRCSARSSVSPPLRPHRSSRSRRFKGSFKMQGPSRPSPTTWGFSKRPSWLLRCRSIPSMPPGALGTTEARCAQQRIGRRRGSRRRFGSEVGRGGFRRQGRKRLSRVRLEFRAAGLLLAGGAVRGRRCPRGKLGTMGHRSEDGPVRDWPARRSAGVCAAQSGFKPLVVCTRETRSTAERAEVLAVDWRDFLLGRRLPGRA
jgi:hypothetical protein